MEKPYLNLKELTEILGGSKKFAKKTMQHLQEIAKEKNFYIPSSKRDVLIPTHLVKKELKLKNISIERNGVKE